MQKSHENLVAVLDSLTNNPKVSVAARRVSVSTMTVYRWLKLSADGAPEFQNISWCGEVGSFHQFFEYAQRAFINTIEQTAKHNATGFDEVVTHDGEIQYQVDPKLVGLDDETMTMLGYADKYLRIDGKVQPLTVKRKPSDALVLRMLAAHKPEIYGEHSTLSVNMNVGGVLRLQRPDEMTKTIEHQAGETFALDAAVTDDDKAAKTSTMLALGRPARTSAEFDKWNANKEFAAAPVTFVAADGTRTVTKAELPLTGDKPLTTLQQDLVRRAEQPPAQPQPRAVMMTHDSNPVQAAALAPVASRPSYEPPEGIGHSKPAPGGYKVA